MTLSAQDAAPATRSDNPAEAAPVVALPEEQTPDAAGALTLRTQVFTSDGAGLANGAVWQLDAETGAMLSVIVGMLGSYMDEYTFELPGETKPSGTLYGFDVGYDFTTKSLGAFTIEAGYRGGTIDYDSGLKAFGGSKTSETLDGPATLQLNGNSYRSVSIDTEKFSLLALWHPKGVIGDFLGVGLGYAHERDEMCYTLGMTIAESESNGGGDETSIVENFYPDFNADNVVVHVRAGGKALPWISARDGTYGFIPTADIAAGYSFRSMNAFHVLDWRDGSQIGDTEIEDNYVQDTWIFEGSACISFFYNLPKGTILLDAGYACETDLGGKDGTLQGFVGKIGYRCNW